MRADSLGSGCLDEAISCERLNELLQVGPDDFLLHAELLADLGSNHGFGFPALEHLQDSRPDTIEVEHLTLLNIKDDRTILTMRAAHGIGNLVHGLNLNNGSDESDVCRAMSHFSRAGCQQKQKLF